MFFPEYVKACDEFIDLLSTCVQVLDLEPRGPAEIQYDEEWLAVLRSTHNLMSLQRRPQPLPGMGHLRQGAAPQDRQFVREAVARQGAKVAYA